MRLASFRTELEALIGQDSDARPFVCDGDPYACKAFIVGINAASPMPFWRYWDDQRGFDRRRWYDDYRAKRQGDYNGPISPTRARIELIVSAAAPVKMLETNLFSEATRRVSELTAEHKKSDVFQFLLDEIEPRVLLLHGARVKTHFERRHRVRLKDAFSCVEVGGRVVHIAAVRHLSRIPYRTATKLGESIRARLA